MNLKPEDLKPHDILMFPEDGEIVEVISIDDYSVMIQVVLPTVYGEEYEIYKSRVGNIHTIALDRWVKIIDPLHLATIKLARKIFLVQEKAENNLQKLRFATNDLVRSLNIRNVISALDEI